MGNEGRHSSLRAVHLLVYECDWGLALSGPTGYVAWREYKVQRSKLQQVVQTSEERQAALQRRLVLLDPRHVDPDLADELVRRNLDLVKPDEVIVPLPQAQSAGN